MYDINLYIIMVRTDLIIFKNDGAWQKIMVILQKKV